MHRLSGMSCSHAAAKPLTSDCRELGFLPVEVNASDTRNKSDAKVKAGIGGKLSNAVRELATNSAIGAGTDGRPKRVCRLSLTHVEFCPMQALSSVCAVAGAQRKTVTS